MKLHDCPLDRTGLPALFFNVIHEFRHIHGLSHEPGCARLKQARDFPRPHRSGNDQYRNF
jgi:hypothetical protein